MKKRGLLVVILFSLSLVLELRAQCNNVLVNGDASTGASGWNFSSGAGSNWLLQNWGYGNAFVASYNWTTMEQTIDLVAEGYTSQYLDEEPLVSFSQMFRGKHSYYNDLYYYKIKLLNGSSQVIDSYSYGSQSAPISTTINWDTLSGNLTSYGTGLRYIHVECGGKSIENWAGNFGTIIDNGVVSIAEVMDTTICGGSYFFNNQYLTTSGTYTQSFSGVYGCDSIIVLNLQVDSLIVEYDSIQPTCHGDDDGSLTLHVSGGTTPYTFAWANGGNDSTVTNLESGAHVFTVTDANGCADTSSITLTEPNELVVTAVLDSNARCYNSNDGGASVTSVGGTGSHTYNWSNSATGNHNSGIVSGDYFVTGTDSNGCVDTTAVFVGILDDVDPIAVVQNISVYLNQSGLAYADILDIDNGSYDNCGIDTMYINIDSFDCDDIGVNQIDFTLVDSNSNSVTTSVQVTVVDTIRPFFLCPSDTAICESTFSYPFPTATDNCSGVSIVQTSCLPSGSTYPVGGTTNTFLATDSAGNESTCSFSVYRGVTPSKADAGLDFGLCVSPSSNLNAVKPSSGMGTWTSLGNAIVIDPNQFNSPVNNLVFGENLFVWTVSDGSCPTNSDTATILVSAKPTVADAVTDATVCDQSAYMLSANDPSVGVGYWTSPYPGIFSDSLSPNSSLLSFNGKRGVHVEYSKWRMSCFLG